MVFFSVVCVIHLQMIHTHIVYHTAFMMNILMGSIKIICRELVTVLLEYLKSSTDGHENTTCSSTNHWEWTHLWYYWLWGWVSWMWTMYSNTSEVFCKLWKWLEKILYPFSQSLKFTFHCPMMHCNCQCLTKYGSGWCW